eukprot:TRINITY_DN97365_c0_g1_i1.p1 TRINITY_DN97365_c0_g1~~TRINITY_DN97365_c0_g1_i1.p1  ORF type:complete len:333 (-),score=79.18 TRINITY_DN97365_c0_g1_i1:7-1005(-)
MPCRPGRGTRLLACLSALFFRPACPTCELPIELPKGAFPAATTSGPQDTLIIAGSRGLLLFANLEDFTTRLDHDLRAKYGDGTLGSLDIKGVTMSNTGSTYLYLGIGSTSKIMEYEWHTSHKVFRSFDLVNFPSAEGIGLSCLAFVPSESSPHQGFFYVGTQISGSVYIYQVPLLNNEGFEATAESVKIWSPLQGNQGISGLDFCSGYIFVCFDDGTSAHVLIFQVLESGFPGDLIEQYEVDVVNAVGMTVRQVNSDSFEVLFTSGSKNAVFVYSFRFVYGFQLHDHCAAQLPKEDDSDAHLRPWQRGAGKRNSASLTLLAAAWLLQVQWPD